MLYTNNGPRRRPLLSSFLGRIACTERKDAAYCYGCSAVCVLVCESVTLSVGHNRELCLNGKNRSRYNLGLWTRVGLRTHVLVGGRIPYGNGQFCGGAPCDAVLRQNSLATCSLSAVYRIPALTTPRDELTAATVSFMTHLQLCTSQSYRENQAPSPCSVRFGAIPRRDDQSDKQIGDARAATRRSV